MLALTLLKYFKRLPDKWLICLTLLLLPISCGAGKRFGETESLSFQHGQTKFKLGEIKAVAQEGDRQLNQLLNENSRLSHSYSKLKSELDDKKIDLSEVKEMEAAIDRSEKIASEASQTQQQLGRLTEEVVEVVEESE